jgi:hypothetical protein
MICSGCNTPIASSHELLKCVACTHTYHYQCLNMTSAVFRELQPELIRTWQCPSCSNVTTRRKTEETPVRKHLQTDSNIFNDTAMSTDDLPYDSQDSLLGDTLRVGRTQEHQLLTTTSIIEQIGNMMEIKLDKNNKNIISELKLLIHSEIDTALHKFKCEVIDKNNTNLQLQQHNLAKQLNELNEKIQTLEKENLLIKSQIKDLLSNSSISTKIEVSKNYETQRRFVLYGLEEYYGETDASLYPRINNMFRDILNIEINGFIESIKRLGRKGNCRPLIIELLSNRLKNYILENAYCFKSTRYAVSDVLSREDLEQRRQLRELLINARRTGKYAVIRQNKLFINGKEYTQTNDTKTQLASRNTSAIQNTVSEPSIVTTSTVTPTNQTSELIYSTAHCTQNRDETASSMTQEPDMLRTFFRE